MSFQFEISLAWFSDVPDLQNNIVVVADVYAATSNIAFLLSQKPKRLLVANEDNVAEAKEEYQDALVVGESKILSESFFDLSNKPSVLRTGEFENKEIIFMTDNGTRAIEKAFSMGASEVLTVSFNNFDAVKKYLENKRSSLVFIAAGDNDKENTKAMEDWYCIETLKNSLEGKPVLLNEVMVNAKSFALEYYGSEENLKEDLELVFQTDTSPLVPICVEQDFITISSVV